jgi:hypothetical protein
MRINGVKLRFQEHEAIDVPRDVADASARRPYRKNAVK